MQDKVGKPESISHMNDVSVYISLTPTPFCLDTDSRQRGKGCQTERTCFTHCVFLKTSGKVTWTETARKNF